MNQNPNKDSQPKSRAGSLYAGRTIPDLASNIWRACFWILFVAAIPFIFSSSLEAQTSNSFWQAQSIYQIITDRFYDGNTNNDNVEGTYNPGDPFAVHGGDFAGLEQKLDYIKALGATAIWISPIVLNTEGQYHGYSAWNYYALAPHWGSITDLQNVVQAAHARGLKVIDDIVVNHAGDLVTGSGPGWPAFNYPTGYDLSYANPNKTYPSPFNLSAANPSLTNLWHNYGNIDNFGSTQDVTLGWLDGLNDLRTETPYVQTNMIAIYEYWINQIGLDAFRVDTALEVDHGCWQTFCPAIYSFTRTNIPYGETSPNTNFFIFGEVDDGSESVCGPYTGTESGGPYEFESTEDYPLYYALNNVFATPSGLAGNTEQIQTHYNNLQTYYDPTTWAQQIIFLDNQDNPRFLSSSESNGNTNALEAALAFLYTSVGIPCLYYGTEQGFSGTTDPDCREDMFAGEWKDTNGTVQSLNAPGVDNFNMTHPLFQWIAKLNNLRRLYPAISLGSYVNKFYVNDSPGFFTYSRILTNQEVFVVLNTENVNLTLPPSPLTYPTNTLIVNLLNTNETYVLDTSSQTPNINVPALSAKIFIARSLWQPLDPVVVSNSPAHWTANVPLLAPVVLQFSDSMNTSSAQSAFGTSPVVSGNFSWSKTILPNDTLTFTPAGGGWPARTQVTITVSNTASSSASGKTLFAPYSLSFFTASPITITSPANNADFAPGSSVAITVDVSQFGSGLTNVSYYSNGLLIGGSATSPYGFSLTNVPTGSFALTAVGRGSLGNAATSSVVNITVNSGIAYDSAANYSSWGASGQNAGYGFQPWFLAGGGQYTGFILTPSGVIDTAGNSWGLYANGNNTPYAYASRGFSNSLAISQIFSVQFANSTGASSGSMGFCLQNSNNNVAYLVGSTTPPAPIVTNAPTRFAFYYADGQADYTIWDNNGASDSGIPYTSSGVTVQFTLVTANTYKLTVLSGTTSTVLGNWQGTLAGIPGSPVQMFSAFNVNTGSFENTYFNSLEISAPGPVLAIAGTNRAITWASRPGVKYEILGTTNLSRAFIPVSGVISATSTSSSYLDPAPLTGQKFYLIEIVP
jgi:glycosidase